MIRPPAALLLIALAGASCTPPRSVTSSNDNNDGSGDGGSNSAPSAVGGPCQSDSDCAVIFGTAQCFTQQEGAGAGVGTPGGYCTSTTCNAGDPALTCGAGTVCGGFGGSGTTFCEAACSPAAACREGYDCSDGGCVPGAPLPPDAGPMGLTDGGPNNTDGGSNNPDGGNGHPDGGNGNADGGCTGGGVITGVVHAPTTAAFGQADPLYNVTVYVPGGTVEAFAPGVTCGTCGMPLSGSPIVQTTTAADGSFTLTNTPVGTDVPLVIQIGRWRRQVQVPTVTACSPTIVSDDLTRLPRTHLEGDIPLIAMVTGTADPLECVLRKIGIDDSEFTTPDGGGRVQIYVGNGASDSTATAPAEATLTATAAALEKYDLVLFGCQGSPDPQPAVADQTNLIDYAGLGGRVLATHYNYVWLFNDQPFEGTADWVPDATGESASLSVTVDQTSSTGVAFADWLETTGASVTHGAVSIAQSRDDFEGVAGSTNLWLYTSAQPLAYSFDTPVSPTSQPVCGRVEFDDFHAYDSTAALGGGPNFPGECDADPMSPSQKTLEFMLFDLGSCTGTRSPDYSNVPSGGINWADGGGTASLDAGPEADGGAADGGAADGGATSCCTTACTGAQTCSPSTCQCTAGPCTGTTLSFCQTQCAANALTCNATTCGCS